MWKENQCKDGFLVPTDTLAESNCLALSNNVLLVLFLFLYFLLLYFYSVVYTLLLLPFFIAYFDFFFTFTLNFPVLSVFVQTRYFYFWGRQIISRNHRRQTNNETISLGSLWCYHVHK